ncbi:MAG: hypothetical protein HY000_16805 [Planctomycetes bacterium]|nr:hypothetical protein [Planctomycetota bacterium]
MLKTLRRNHPAFAATFLALAALSIALSSAAVVRAQAGSKTQGTKSDVALDGHCAVCVVEMQKWVQGDPRHQATYDGKTYYFPGKQQKDMFLANPAKYVPALGGDCTVCYAKMGKRVPGKIGNALLHEHRLFLFPSDEQEKEFQAHPDQYANVDLALDGNCAVCRVEMKKDVPGKPEIAVVHQGLRYLFPRKSSVKCSWPIQPSTPHSRPRTNRRRRGPPPSRS